MKKFTNKAISLLKGWKVRQVMRCLKVREEIKAINMKNK